MSGYFHAYIRRALANELEELLKAYPELGYGKTNGAVNEAVRRFVVDLRREITERDPKAKTSDHDLPPVEDALLFLRRAMRDERKKKVVPPTKRSRSG